MLNLAQKKWGMGIILTWHDLKQAKSFVNYIYKLDQANLTNLSY